MLTLRRLSLLACGLVAVSGCASTRWDGHTCETDAPTWIVYDGRYRIDIDLPKGMEVMLLERSPTVLDVATKKGSGQMRSATILMLGSDVISGYHRYRVSVVLEYSTDSARPTSPSPERILEHSRAQTGPDIRWDLVTLKGGRWVYSDRRDRDEALRQESEGVWKSRDSTELFIRPIDADVDLRVVASYLLKRDVRPEGWLQARSSCTHEIVSSIKVSTID